MTRSSRSLVVVPMKDPKVSKTRLSGALSAPARANLARLLFKRTVAVLKAAQALADFDIAVVTQSPAVAALAQDMVWIEEDADSDLSRAVAQSAQWAQNQNYSALCVIPADLAAPDPADIAALIHQARVPGVAICPSQDLGTNALVVAPPAAMAFAYGPKSALRHMELAETAGLSPRLMPMDSLKFDIDTSACLERALAEVPELHRDWA